MRKALISILAGVIFASLAPRVHAQAPTTFSELKAIVRDVARTSKEIEELDDKMADVETRAQDFLERYNRHQNNQCMYRPGHPEECATYATEAKNLDAEARALNAEVKMYEGQTASLRSHMQLQFARIKLAPLFSGLETWTRRVQRCVNLPTDEKAVRCLNDAWEEHP